MQALGERSGEGLGITKEMRIAFLTDLNTVKTKSCNVLDGKKDLENNSL